jgi:hypothetical protein
MMSNVVELSGSFEIGPCKRGLLGRGPEQSAMENACRGGNEKTLKPVLARRWEFR